MKSQLTFLSISECVLANRYRKGMASSDESVSAFILDLF